MKEVPPYASAHPDIRAIDFNHVLVLIDYRTGRVRCLLPAKAAQWRDVMTTGHTASLPTAGARYLLTMGLLTPTPFPRPMKAPVVVLAPSSSWGSTEHAAGVARPSRGPWLAAAAAMTLVFAVKRAGRTGTTMRRLTKTLDWASSLGRLPASAEQVRSASDAVRRVGWLSPGRTACLEESAAVVLLLSARRLGVTWCHGVAPDPVRLHAWVETWDGEAVGEPYSTRAYTPVLTIGDPRHRL
ncbi:lasso peptide biosynthesis B2 protein [Streptomyces sp. NPDC005576]|uniref:lasso peptide biosynthesis B2 protein n=1 Tax=unclassified Streptomyces TaxID=2593676 RepID=UPI0033F9FF06